MSYFDLKNRNIAITGANGYLGRAMVEGLLDAGAQVLALCRHKENLVFLEEKFGSRLKVDLVDCSDEEKLKEAFHAFHDHYGEFDGLINNIYAGTRTPQLFEEKEMIFKTLDATFVSYWIALRSILPYLNKKQSSIINNGSLWGVVSPDPKNYLDLNNEPSISLVSAKAAVHQFTKYSAVLLSKEKVRVNTIVPGWFPQKRGVERLDYIEGLCKKIPLNRIGKPHEIVGPILFLLSDGSGYMTGQELIIDGGYTLT
jgi:NAD(P)-dependent dehydrogenase (short-subunit alcohol dehydrogenase family)